MMLVVMIELKKKVSSSGKVYVGGNAIKSLTDSEIGDMPSSITWRKVRSIVDEGVGGETEAWDDDVNCSR